MINSVEFWVWMRIVLNYVGVLAFAMTLYFLWTRRENRALRWLMLVFAGLFVSDFMALVKSYETLSMVGQVEFSDEWLRGWIEWQGSNIAKTVPAVIFAIRAAGWLR